MRRDQGDLLEGLSARLQDAVAHAQAAVERSEVLAAVSQLARNPAAMARRCAWCGRLELGRSWRVPQYTPPLLLDTLERRATHTICPDCVERLEQSGRSRQVDGASVNGEEAGDAEAEDDHREP